MALSELDCPHCGQTISLGEALERQVGDDIERRLQEKLLTEKKRLQDGLKKETDALTVELKRELQEKSQKLLQQQQVEMELRKKTRLLEEKEKNLELEFLRKFDHEKNKFQEEVSRRLGEESRFKMAEKEKQLADMRGQIEELKRKAEQGPVELQGEVLEREIESELKAFFPLDHIGPVPKGIRGGDIIHSIQTNSGQKAGVILWEMKRTKHWSDQWTQKLKDDSRAINADLAILVSQCLPKGIQHLGLWDGVWVCDYASYEALGRILRGQVMQVFLARMQAQGKGEKMDFLYDYLTGNQFKQRIEALIEAFRTMQDELEKEKRAMQRSWALREMQISKVLQSTSGMYGDIQGIVGSTSLPTLQVLDWAQERPSLN